MKEATEQAILDQLATLERDIEKLRRKSDKDYKALGRLILDKVDNFTGADK